MFNVRFIIGFICLLALISASVTFAQTEVEGEVSGIWEAENSPYILTGTCTVQEDDTLTISPGVEVIFLDMDSLFVVGHLVAEGTEEDSIFFHGDFEQEEVGKIMIWESVSMLLRMKEQFLSLNGVFTKLQTIMASLRGLIRFFC